MTYKDITFCPFSKCKNFNQEDCPRAYTKEVEEAAKRWMDPPLVAFYMHPPECYDE
jgi:hypothetical protein